MKSTKTIEVNTTDAIALCYAKDDFEEFNQRLVQFLRQTIGKDATLSDLKKISHNEKTLFSIKTRKFYKENKRIIDIINSHTDIVSFIYNNYNIFDDKDKIEFKNSLFYQYILRNKEHQEKILIVLYKINSLGFRNFYFSEQLDFTNHKYRLCNQTPNNIVDLFDNIEVIPGYDKESTEYQTNSSNYKITLYLCDGEIIENIKKIYLNSLTFDVKRLPNEISTKEITETFKKEVEKKTKEYTQIRSYIDLFSTTDQIENTIRYLENIINQIDTNYNKSDLKETLSNIKDQTVMLKILINFYENYLIEHNPNITKDLLVKEKKLCRAKKDN